MSKAAHRVYRKEALQALQGGARGGDLLRISPRWIHYCYWFLSAVLSCCLAYSIIGTINEYAEGPAIVRVEGRSNVTATGPGTVAAVKVQPGQRVRRGQLLVQFYAAEEEAALSRLDQELELQLIKTLRDPGDASARQALTALRVQREQTEKRLDERYVRSPAAGLVSDIRIRPGQLLNAGDLICTIMGADASLYVTALLPGHYRPMLRRNMPIRLELVGFEYSYQDLLIQSVGDEVVGPAETRRYLGQDLGDAVAIPQSVVFVQARLPAKRFLSEGRYLQYYSGTPGLAQVVVRRQSILVALIPALKLFFGDEHA
jgi:biotin carboxyl carrier protein